MSFLQRLRHTTWPPGQRNAAKPAIIAFTCALATSDSQVMAQRMRELGAGEVMTFPFGLEALPALPPPIVV